MNTFTHVVSRAACSALTVMSPSSAGRDSFRRGFRSHV